MSIRTRAIVIGLLGPVIASLGLALVLVEAALDSTPESADLRFLVFDSGHLVVITGIIVSVVCAPLSISVALASEEEVAMPEFTQEVVDGPIPAQPDEPRLAAE